MEFLECVLEWFQVSFSEKKFKEWWSSQMNRKPLAYDPCPEDFARWGYAEANRNADDAEANGKIIGYDLAVAELKARDAKLREVLETESWDSLKLETRQSFHTFLTNENVDGIDDLRDCFFWWEAVEGEGLVWRVKFALALLLLVEEAKTK